MTKGRKQNMTVNDILFEYLLIPELTLICIETTSGNVIYCGERCEYKPEQNYKIRAIFPESYGKYYGRHGITILVD